MDTIICIGRQYGTGVREIGKQLAHDYDIPFYDKELLTRIAKESGFSEEMIAWHDEKPTSSFLYNLVMDTYSFGYNYSSVVDMPLSQKIFLAGFETIKKIAGEGPCVIVGRCADYALADNEKMLSIFLHGPIEERMNRIMEVYSMDDKSAKETISKKDKQRQSYYNYYTSKKWGTVESYDLSINRFKYGMEGTIKLIKDSVNEFETIRKRQV